MIHLNSALSQDLLKIAVGYTISDAEKHGMQDDVLWEPRTLDRHNWPYLDDKSGTLIGDFSELGDRTESPAYPKAGGQKNHQNLLIARFDCSNLTVRRRFFQLIKTRVRLQMTA